ncbi:MAG: hypothetical protein ACOXZ0_05175 [Eubacteriales bacterium]|jgi:hypothetical protein
MRLHAIQQAAGKRTAKNKDKMQEKGLWAAESGDINRIVCNLTDEQRRSFGA